MIRPADTATSGVVIPLQPPKDRPVIETQVILARHRGRCHGCRGCIQVSEPIQRVSGDWHHEECVPHGAVEGWRDAA